MDLFIDVEKAAVEPDIKRPARREAAYGQDAGGDRGLLCLVAENWVRQAERAGELRVRAGRIYAGRKILHVETTQGLVACAERATLGGASPSERLGKPGNHHRLPAAEIAELVRPAVGGRSANSGARSPALRSTSPFATRPSAAFVIPIATARAVAASVRSRMTGFTRASTSIRVILMMVSRSAPCRSCNFFLREPSFSNFADRDTHPGRLRYGVQQAF